MNRLLLMSLLFLSGCATTPVYEVDFTNLQKPQMSFDQARRQIENALEKMTYQLSTLVVADDSIYACASGGGSPAYIKFSDYSNLSVNVGPGYYYVPLDKYYYLVPSPNGGWWLKWASRTDAQSFVDAFTAMKYYASKGPFVDETAAFADFQRKADAWRAMPQKPPLPEEVFRYRVLADDAINNKEFSRAADFYEQGLRLDPLWPAGQYNAAIIDAELDIFPLAVRHMKRYLALKPGDPNARVSQDKIYIWEEKAKEN
ncbi:MAG: hypothetical protein KGK03_11145 [Candidatus Omnitrophica bacterium]|nr:hypothetical protein [Candidatus Omnitrophota bacterium]MDE2223613.1 hypothetical protein [Candidatus Omnitrophota bacterium]